MAFLNFHTQDIVLEGKVDLVFCGITTNAWYC